MNNNVKIRVYKNRADRDQVIAIWKSVFNYGKPYSDPALSIDKKLKIKDNLLFVAALGKTIIGTVMVGYDGHRGWIYSLAVLPDKRAAGVGTRLMEKAESTLKKLGCVKVNLQIIESNSGVVEFYKKLGFSVEPRINMGKVLFSR